MLGLHMLLEYSGGHWSAGGKWWVLEVNGGSRSQVVGGLSGGCQRGVVDAEVRGLVCECCQS